MKGFIEVEVPESCSKCKFNSFQGMYCNINYFCEINKKLIDNKISKITRPNDCPIKTNKEVFMASKNKKKKAKNSYLHNGADKSDCKLKRIMYYTKRNRAKNKKIIID